MIGFPGYVSTRRYRTLMGDDEYNEISLFKFRDEASLQHHLTSDHRKRVSVAFDRRFGACPNSCGGNCGSRSVAPS